jgi:hypothetical protein
MYLKPSRPKWQVYASKLRGLVSPQTPFFRARRIGLVRVIGPIGGIDVLENRPSVLENDPPDERPGKCQIVCVLKANTRRDTLGDLRDFYALPR